MTTEVDTEEIQTTRSEKLLALVLAAFLLVGGLWIYFKLDDVPAKPDYEGPAATRAPSEADRRAIARRDAARRRLFARRQEERQAQDELELRREAYRTALDAGRPAAALERSYRNAQEAYAASRKRTQAAEAAHAATRPAAAAAKRRTRGAQGQRARELRDQERKHDRETFFLRLGYVLATIALGYWLLGRVRRRRPRYLVLALAFVAFAAAQAIVMATDYLYDYVEFEDVGLLTISLAGVAMTIAAFVALQRYLQRRIPMRRVRRRECPFCGYPVGDNDRCEGCGRAVFADCSTCSQRRRVGTAHCGVCGAA